MNKKLFSLFALISLLLGACNFQASGTISFTGDFTSTDSGVILRDGATITAVTPLTLKGDNGINIVLAAGQSVKAIGDVTVDIKNFTYTGTLQGFDGSSAQTTTATATPVLTSTPTVVPLATQTSAVTSWICYTPGAEKSKTYSLEMGSNPSRVLYPVSDISLCPFGEGTFFNHWTQIGASGDKLGDSQGWFRQGDKKNVINECAQQSGWCLVSNN